MKDNSHIVESYKFWDVVSLWGRERLVHEVLVAKELIKGIICDGLRFQSDDPKWMQASENFRAYPYVGYSANQDELPIVIKAKVLQHMLSVVQEDAEPSRVIIGSEHVTKSDFQKWLVRTGKSFPKFWFLDRC